MTAPIRPHDRQKLERSLRSALAETNELALFNVTHDNHNRPILDEKGDPIPGLDPRGGPFGAMLAISFPDGTFEQIGQARGNNVVNSGISSAHAEDQVLAPDNYAKLLTRLAELKGQNPTVWVISSGQSCPTCHTKQEIVARELVARGLIQPGHFNTLYGATYDETFKIAQFYDALYADGIVFQSLHPTSQQNLIQFETRPLDAIPAAVREVFAQEHATAAVCQEEVLYSFGDDQRTRHDRFSTAGVEAIRHACRKFRGDKPEQRPWEVSGTLYVLDNGLGPLLMSEASWTNIRTIVCVQMPETSLLRSANETRGLSNDQFLHIIAKGYGDPEAAIRVYRDTQFRNTAQPVWRRVLEANRRNLYNGGGGNPAIEAMRNEHTRFRFAAPDLAAWFGDKGVAAQPLAELRPG
jgi:hypothetical protein